MNELQAYVKEHHTTGVSWNPKGNVLEPSKISNGPSSFGPPPPPPPPPSLPEFDLLADNSSAEDLQAELAKELNVGTDITKSLRKVNDDQ